MDMIQRVKIAITSLLLFIQLGCSPAVANFPEQVNDPGFDQVRNGLPAGWHLDHGVLSKGHIEVGKERVGGDGGVLLLAPNHNNHGEKLLGVGQLIDARRFLGKTVLLKARLGANGASNAVVGLHALGEVGDLGHVQIRRGDTGGALVDAQDTLDVPRSAKNLIIYALAEGTNGEVLFDLVNIEATVGKGQVAAVSESTGARIRIFADQRVRSIPDTLFGANVEWIQDAQGMWSVEERHFKPGAVGLSRDLNVSLLRYPGGVFSDFYNWRDGVGPQDQRPVRAHYPNGPSSALRVGTLEIADFANEIGAELMLTANAGTGTAEEAADWVHFANVEHRLGVRHWEIGNELYMRDDLSGAHMSADQYAKQFLRFADAMRRADPTIRIGGIGGLNYGRYRFIADDRWTEKLLRKAAPQMDYLAIHNAYAPVVIGVNDSVDPVAVYRAMLAAPVAIEKNLADVSSLIRRYEIPGRPIDIAVTEWGPFFHVDPASPWVDHVKTMGSALFVASTMNAFLRTPKVRIANFFKLSDYGFMGWIGQRQNRFIQTAPYKAFAMYRKHLGRNLVSTTVDGPTFDAPGLGVVKAAKGVPYLDAVATLDGDRLTVVVVNKHISKAISTQLTLDGVRRYEGGKATSLSALSLDANTGSQLPLIPGLQWARQVDLGRFNVGGESEIRERTVGLPGGGRTLEYSFPPLSITSLTVRVER